MKDTINDIPTGGSDEDWIMYYLECEKDKMYSPPDSPHSKIDGSQYSLIEKSAKHLRDSNMGYWYHFKHSITNGNKLLLLVLSSYAHAILPGKLKQHAARGVIQMYEDMKQWPHLRKSMYEISQETRKLRK